MEFDSSEWSGEGAFTQLLVDALRTLSRVQFVKVQDAPTTRAEAAFSFISNEVYVGFVPDRRARLTILALSSALESLPGIGAPDYADESMLQYLRTERVIPPYQTRGYKLIELVRIYEVGSARPQTC
jgi:hypothetical protein